MTRRTKLTSKRETLFWLNGEQAAVLRSAVIVFVVCFALLLLLLYPPFSLLAVDATDAELMNGMHD